MSPPRLKPTDAELASFRARLARDPESPTGLVWRGRPLSDFQDEAQHASWTTKWAWKTAGTQQPDGRFRIAVNGPQGRRFSVDVVLAALEAMGDETLRADDNALDETSGGTLADILESARRDLGMTLGDLTVLSPAHDPYRSATPSLVRDAQWAADRFAEGSAVHLRNFHYQLIGGATKPNGGTYSGSNKDWRWLKRATAAARWRGLIPFDALEDRRNDEPFTYRAERDTTELEVGVGASFGAEPPTIDIFDGEEGELRLFPTIAGMQAEQRFVIAMFGEKSSLKGEMDPLARELGSDLYLETGEQSATHVYHIAQRADADGRDLVVLCVTDCDPSGYQMAVSIARKLQALIDLYFPALNATVIHVGLTPAQVRKYNLPSSPLNPKEQRKARWRERMGVEQTEIDALLSRHPGVLTGMICEALKPYYDPTLNGRVWRAEREWRADAQAKIEVQVADDPELSGPMQSAEEWAADVATRIEGLNTRIEQIRGLVDEVNDEGDSIKNDIASVDRSMSAIVERIELEPPEIPKPELPEQPEDGANLVFSSTWSWVEATENMKARKAYEVGDGEENDDTEEDDEDDDS